MSKNIQQFPGYVAIPFKLRKKHPELEGVQTITLDFNSGVGDHPSNPDGYSLERMNFRVYLKGATLSQNWELGMVLQPEQWLDLMDAMKAEYERAMAWIQKVDKENRGEEPSNEPGEDS